MLKIYIISVFMLNYNGNWIEIYFSNVKFWWQTLKLKLFVADSLMDRLFQAIAPLYLMDFLIKFVSGLGGAISLFDTDNNGKAKLA